MHLAHFESASALIKRCILHNTGPYVLQNHIFPYGAVGEETSAALHNSAVLRTIVDAAHKSDTSSPHTCEVLDMRSAVVVRQVPHVGLAHFCAVVGTCTVSNTFVLVHACLGSVNLVRSTHRER